MKFALVFPGQGSQSVAMMQPFADVQVVKDTFTEASDALSQDIADRWSVGRRVVNDYGPTETTITALRAIIEPGKPVAIGVPVPGMQAWVVTPPRSRFCVRM